MSTFLGVIIASWAAFILVWLGLSFFVKRDVRGGRFARAYQVRMLVIAILVVVIVRALRRHRSATHHLANSLVVFTPSLSLAWIGVALTALGIAVAIWARLYLGRNWSASPAVKEGHELVTTGPYAFVRHPIYSGITLATLGTALTGSIFGIAFFIIVTTIFLFRVGTEERYMLELFPGTYPAYRARTKRLVPLIW